MPALTLDDVFRDVASRGRMAFMPFLCAGDPDLETSFQIAETLVRAGADVLEVGLPFSDPIADGPTIQKASQRALAACMNTDAYFSLCKRISATSATPLVAMTYFNLILHYGIDRFVHSSRQSGISGVIVPDLPYEECRELEASCQREGVSLIQLVALTTDDRRLDRIIQHAHGFIYLVSVLGVTGARDKVSKKVPTMLASIRRRTRLPVCLGFGISKREHVLEAKRLGFSGVIVGSALIDVVASHLGEKDKLLSELYRLACALKEAT